MPPVFRFAPSPNGYLHLGHALSALLNADMAQAAGGRLLLRIEDIDETRCRPEYEAAIYEDLAWLGLAWERAGAAAVGTLRRLPRRARPGSTPWGSIYPSFESRAEIARMVAEREAKSPWPRDPDGAPLYPGDAKNSAAAERARRMAAGAPYALRLDMAAALERTGPLTWTETGAGPSGETGTIAADPAAWGDVILARKDYAHQLSSRGRRSMTQRRASPTWCVGATCSKSTAVHRLLQALLGWPAPRYHHHRLILDAEGRKLSKSTLATGLRELRAQGATAADIRS